MFHFLFQRYLLGLFTRIVTSFFRGIQKQQLVKQFDLFIKMKIESWTADDGNLRFFNCFYVLNTFGNTVIMNNSFSHPFCRTIALSDDMSVDF